MLPLPLLLLFPFLALGFLLSSSASAQVPPFAMTPCRSYCGNITVDYPFALRPGCGHPGFRELLFCINGVLMLHIPSGSYRVLDLDYAYRGLTLHDPDMSTCRALVRPPVRGGSAGNGFVLEPWRAPYLEPAPDNVFLLLGCAGGSPLFQGFPGKHLPCREVAGMGCEGYYGCPAWEGAMGLRGWRGGPGSSPSPYGEANPPACCGVPYGAIRGINLTRLACEGYSSAYGLAPVRARGGALDWSYGIRVGYSVPGEHEEACRGCETTGGACGHDEEARPLCLCPTWNSTSNCDASLAGGDDHGVLHQVQGNVAVEVLGDGEEGVPDP
ncbi:hypothetical protein Taro_053418 [Colocasia esculenta]|uniref:Wall-associated receptor kinase galacturonan-binding domain-containing protein n=1 Tax=Colocasia esculenta TaxID=4460 RepID=A0A843XMR5_COLES|nr:hypothetical protein [Colocasia esculenta]